MTARFVSVCIAVEKRDVPPMPSVALVRNVCESTIEMELLSAFTVKIVLLWKLTDGKVKDIDELLKGKEEEILKG